MADVSEVREIKHRANRIRGICQQLLDDWFEKGETFTPTKMVGAIREVEALTKGIDTYADLVKGYIEEVHSEDVEISKRWNPERD